MRTLINNKVDHELKILIKLFTKITHTLTQTTHSKNDIK